MKVKELRRFKVDGAPAGVYAADNTLFFWTMDSSKLHAADLKTGGLSAMAETDLVQPLGMSFSDKTLFYLERQTRVLYRTKLDKFAPEKLLDLARLDLNGHNPALHCEGAEVSDVCVRGKSLLLSVIAGYSSGVYRVDADKAKVTGFFFSNGPEPRGVVQDIENKLVYVADAGEGYLVQFKAAGKFTGNAAKLPTRAPQGLDMDAKRNFYVGARDTGEVIQFTVEEG